MYYCSLCTDNKLALTKKPFFYCIEAFYKYFSKSTPFLARQYEVQESLCVTVGVGGGVDT